MTESTDKATISGKLKELASVLEKEKDPEELDDVTSQLMGMLEMCMQRRGSGVDSELARLLKKDNPKVNDDSLETNEAQTSAATSTIPAENSQPPKPVRVTAPRKPVTFTPTYDKPRTRGKKINAEWVAQLRPNAYKSQKISDESEEEEVPAKDTAPEQKRKRGRPRKETTQIVIEENKKRKVEDLVEEGVEQLVTVRAKDGEGQEETVIVVIENDKKMSELQITECEVDVDAENEMGGMGVNDHDYSQEETEDLDSDSHLDIDIKAESGAPHELLDELSVNWPKCFLCGEETETFSGHDEFALHVKEKHCTKGKKNATFVLCPEQNCGRKTYMYKFSTKDTIKVIGQLLLHMMKVHGMKAPDYVTEHKCAKCDYTTVIQNALMAHNHFVHKHASNAEKVTCPYCVTRIRPEKTTTANAPTMKQPIEMRCFFCEDDKRFDNKLNYMNHFRTHHVTINEDNDTLGTIACPTCGKKSHLFEVKRGCMVKLAALSIFHHMVRLHDAPIPYFMQTFKCESCDYTTMLPRALRDHMKGHNGELCEQCGKELHYSMKEHRLYYCKNGPPPSERRKGGGPCPECGTKFENYIHLKAHIRKVHRSSNKRVHVCKTCKYSTKSISTLLEHQFQKHGENSRKRRLIPCVEEGCRFFTLYSYALREHLAVRHHAQKWPCQLCGKVFKQLSKINQHMNHVHNQNRPYICEKCNYAAKTKFALRAHMKRCGQFGYRRVSTDILFVERPQEGSALSRVLGDKQVHVLEIPSSQASGQMQIARVQGEEIIVQQMPESSKEPPTVALEFELTPEGYLKTVTPGSRTNTNTDEKQTLHVLEVSDDIDNDADLKKMILEQLGQQEGNIIVQRGDQTTVPKSEAAIQSPTDGRTIIFQQMKENGSSNEGHIIFQNPGEVEGLPEELRDGQVIILQTEDENGQITQQGILQNDVETVGDETVVRVIVNDCKTEVNDVSTAVVKTDTEETAPKVTTNDSTVATSGLVATI